MLVVVGGHSRNIGKTSVVCGIIEGLRDWNWTAIKVTQYGHGVCSHEGEACECADPRHPVALSEEHGAAPDTDSGRFLKAGARRAWWLRTASGQLGEALPRLKRLIGETEHTIVESNSLLQFLKPDLCLMVLDGAVADFKASSLRFLDRADALVVTSGAPLAWQGVGTGLIAGKPHWEALAPNYRSDAILEAIRLKKSRVSADKEHR